MFESVQSYVKLVNGLSRATRAGARSGAREFLAESGLRGAADDAGEKVGSLTEEIRNAGRANRELLAKLVDDEVTRAVRRLGFVRSDDLDEVREEIAELRHQLARQGPGDTGLGTAAAATKATKRSTTAAATGPSTTTTAGKVAAAKRAAARASAAAGATDPDDPASASATSARRPRSRPPGKAPGEGSANGTAGQAAAGRSSGRRKTSALGDVAGAATDLPPTVPGSADAGA